jgi:DNA adenine methylase
MALRLQPFPYQGSKRNIAEKIVRHFPAQTTRLVEPFAGSAAISIFAAQHRLADRFVINDSYEPLINLWKAIIKDPETCATEYERLWAGQLDDPNEYYYKVREEFNESSDPIKFLYLMARCVKNAIRFNSSGQFNQSPDKRRLGRRPDEMRKQIISTALTFKNKASFYSVDYEEILQNAVSDDLVYMDPPYQGTSTKKDSRYHQGLDFGRFVRNLEELNNRGIPYILSFDGSMGDKVYGEPLPSHLMLDKIAIHAGRSAQATLNGNDHLTIESLYLSPAINQTVSLESLLVAA